MTSHSYGFRPYGVPNTRLRNTTTNFRPEYSRNAGVDHRDPDRRDHDRDRHRRRNEDREAEDEWFVPYYVGYPYAYSYLGYPYAFGFGDYGMYDDSANAPNTPNYAPNEYAGYDEQPSDQEQEQDQPAPYRPSYGESEPASEPISEPANEETVTLVFKDHRPDEQIRNYLLNGSTLSVWDQHPRDIPVNQLDLAATEKVNRDAGIDFRLPGAPR